MAVKKTTETKAKTTKSKVSVEIVPKKSILFVASEANPFAGTGGLADEDASSLGGADSGVGHGFGQGFLGFAILHEFDTGEEAAAASVADDGVLVHEALEAVEEVVAHGDAVFEQVFALDDGDVFKSGSGASGAATEGGDVAEEVVGVVGEEVFEHLFGGDGAGDGSVAGSNALGHGDDVGSEIPVLVAEPLARRCGCLRCSPAGPG